MSDRKFYAGVSSEIDNIDLMHVFSFDGKKERDDWVIQRNRPDSPLKEIYGKTKVLTRAEAEKYAKKAFDLCGHKYLSTWKGEICHLESL